MDYSNTAFFTIPKYDLGDFLQIILRNSKNSYLHFQIVQTLIRGLQQEPSGLGLNYLKNNNMDSLQRATGLKGLKAIETYNIHDIAYISLRYISLPNIIGNFRFTVCEDNK